MKNNFIVFSAVLIAAALAVSCQTREFEGSDYAPQKGDVLFRLGNSSKTTTKSSYSPTRQGITVDLGTINGTNFHLEESISYIDDMVSGPATKGTPAFTENFNALYGTFSAAVFRAGETEAFDNGAFELVDASNNLYKRKYADDLWEKEGLYFFARTPVGIIDDQTIVSRLRYFPATVVDTTAGTIKFHYDSKTLTKPEQQKDILFTSRPVTTEAEFKQLTSSAGLPILFQHALTGVKFAIDNYGGDKGISIDSVIFNGLFDSGDCTINPPTSEGGNYIDDPSVYSSATQVVWNGLDASSTEYTAAFSDTVYFAPGGNFGSDDNIYPSSFSQAGNKHNLNDAAATQTFWFIPQAMSMTTPAARPVPVNLTVVYTFDGQQQRWTLNLSEIVGSTVWQAGEIRTYTIRIDEVNVKIEDKVNMAPKSYQTITDPFDPSKTYQAASYAGSYKDSVIITNTGNTDAFIRAALIGQWLDENGDPIFGYTDFTAGKVVLVDSWFVDQFASGSTPGEQGSFTGLPGYKGGANPVNGSSWILCSDGYYYYQDPVAPGDTTATRLFQKYIVGSTPAVAVAGKVKDVVFQLEIATQAISAKTINGDDYDWDEAWENATGVKPTKQ